MLEWKSTITGGAYEPLGQRGEVLECTVRSPGSARRLGAAAALAHFPRLDPARFWLANTDADSEVPADWLVQHLRLAEQGVTAIAGIVQLGEVPAHAQQLAARWRAGYELRADGSHPHVHGANIGVRADAYLDAGGWGDLALAEDHCLWRRLGQRGWRQAATVHSVVVTSARLYGRARGGFADTLRALERHHA